MNKFQAGKVFSLVPSYSKQTMKFPSDRQLDESILTISKENVKMDNVHVRSNINYTNHY